MDNFDAIAELKRIRELRQIKRYRKSKLDRFRGEILALAKAGASTADIALWLREHKLRADATTVSRYLAKQKALLENVAAVTHGHDSNSNAEQTPLHAKER